MSRVRSRRQPDTSTSAPKSLLVDSRHSYHDRISTSPSGSSVVTSAAQHGRATSYCTHRVAIHALTTRMTFPSSSEVKTIRSSPSSRTQAGGIAGTTVDTSLFPLDTLKTRLQSSAGFWASGGFRGVYDGIGSAVVGSAPGAALFFVTYEATKQYLGASTKNSKYGEAGTHMAAASLGEIAACAVRVPTEVVKQRAQAKQHPSSLAALTSILGQRHMHGVAHVWRELYRGWSITVMREVPFTIIQFPLWEGMKKWSLQQRTPPRPADVTGAESALYGAISGAIAAAATTPLDVLKTRMMLSTTRRDVLPLTIDIWRNEGGRVFFSGIGPRITWISIGGAVFLGSYQWASNMLGGR